MSFKTDQYISMYNSHQNLHHCILIIIIISTEIAIIVSLQKPAVLSPGGEMRCPDFTECPHFPRLLFTGFTVEYITDPCHRSVLSIQPCRYTCRPQGYRLRCFHTNTAASTGRQTASPDILQHNITHRQFNTTVHHLCAIQEN
jgi:hypothetical protein